MTNYSHSKLGTFQQCNYKYKLQYIDKIKVDIPDTVETFLGGLVHEALDKLYKDLQFQKVNTKEELIEFFEKLWEEKWTDNILIVKKQYSVNNYKDMGKKFIGDYYDHYKPFDQTKTIGLETQDFLDLGDGYGYHIRIDRLGCDKEGNYYVCDYKTNNRLKAQGELDEDKQLAMYSLWVKKHHPDCNDVKLVWYFLAFDKEMVSERSDEQLEELKNETIALIKEIEACEDFPVEVTGLCGWCTFQSLCPAWKHKYEAEAKVFSDDDGVKLVDEFAKFKDVKKEAEDKMGILREDLIGFAKQKGIEFVFGTDKKCSVKEFDKVVYPENKEELIELLKEKGVYEEFCMLCYPRLNSKILKKEVDKEIIELTSKEKSFRLSLSKRGY